MTVETKSIRELRHYRRVGAEECHYNGYLMSGAHILQFVSDAAGELLIRHDGEGGLLAAVEQASFHEPVYAGVPCYDSLDLAARCLRALHERAAILERLGRDDDASPAPARAGEAHLTAARGRPRRNLTEPEALAFLAAHGIPVPPVERAWRRDEAVAAADALGYPVVLKIVSADIVHKSEVGGVALDLRTAADVAAAFSAVTRRARERAPAAALDGVLLAPYRGGATEVIGGIVRDPQFGPVLMAGLGGIFAEATADTALRVLPAGRGEIAGMLRELRGFAVLSGARGRPPVDLGALEALLVGLGRVAVAHPEIAGLDLKPILAFPQGAVVADARVILAGPDGRMAPEEV